MENNKEIKRLTRALQLKEFELENFLQYAREIIRVFDEDRLFKTFLSTVMGQTGISRCILRVKAKDRVYIISKGIKLPPILREVLEKGREDLVEILGKFGFGTILELTIASEQTALMFKEKGVEHLLSLQENFLAISGTDAEKINGENENYIKALFQITLLAYENMLFRRETVEKHRLERELEIAKEIQQNLLPKEMKIEGFQAYGKSIPSRYVGGDYYDLYKIGDKYLMALGDVAGKGIPASLLMASIQSSLRAIASFSPGKISTIMKELNEITIKNTERMTFITFFLFSLDPSNGEIVYSNAGHNPPVLMKGEKFIELNKGGMVLGIRENEYESGKEKMESGDMLFLYTDGLSEAMRCEDEFGIEGIKAFLSRNRGTKPENLGKLLLNYMKDFSVEDDLTFLIIKRLP